VHIDEVDESGRLAGRGDQLASVDVNVDAALEALSHKAGGAHLVQHAPDNVRVFHWGSDDLIAVIALGVDILGLDEPLAAVGVTVFGPEHAPLEQRQVENSWQEARALKPDLLLFCAFQFDNEAAKDIDELTPAIAGMQLLKVQMNADMLTDDLRKKRSSNESFWLVGQPDVQVHKMDNGKVQVEVLGFDYYNPKTGNVDSGGKKNIAMWLLDTDYDNRSLFPSQVFFPMSGAKDGWSKLARNLKAEIDAEKIEVFRGTKSLEFEPGKVIAVKIIDDRGIESLRLIGID